MSRSENFLEAQVAVVGAGYWGKNLVRNFHELGVLRLICDKNPSLLEQFERLYPTVETCIAFTDVLGRDGISAVVIATPAESHFALVREALRAGKHVLVEKPLALTEAEGRELVAVAEEKRLTLMVGHILQYHPAVIRLKELIDSGELGKIQYIYSNRLNIGKIRTEENILWSFAPHDISVILMLLGEMPESVYATGGSYLQQHVPDTTVTTLDFPSGVKAHIFVSWLHPFKEQKLVVVGDQKMAVFDDLSDEKLLLYPHRIQWLNRMPVATKGEAETPGVEMKEPLRAECMHFLECAGCDFRPRTDGPEGLRVLAVLQASQESLNQNGCKICLGESGPRMKAKAPHSVEPRLPSDPTQGYFVHESSYIDPGVEIGAGTKIWHFSHILSGSRIGRNCNIGQNVVIGPDVTIGNTCKIQNNVSVYKGVTLEDEVFCGPSMVFTNVYNPRSATPRMNELRPTLVKRGATIGANATILCGVAIGKCAFIAAGAVVLREVPDHALMAGNPAEQKGWMCECGEGLNEYLKCPRCSRHYKQIAVGLQST